MYFTVFMDCIDRAQYPMNFFETIQTNITTNENMYKQIDLV